MLSFQTRLLLTLLAALALGLGLALFTMRKILKLEDQARLQYVEVAEARTQLKELSARLVQAQETERRSLSRELHDEVGQALSAVLIELRNLSAGLAVRSEEQSRRQVETIKGLVESTVRVVRNMALLLRPSMLDDLGLVPALKWQARESSKTHFDGCERRGGTGFRRVAGRVQDLHLSRGPGSAAQLRTAFARAPQSASACEQELDRLLLTIQDDGQGFDVQANERTGVARDSGARYAARTESAEFTRSRDAERYCRWNCPSPEAPSNGSGAQRS